MATRTKTETATPFYSVKDQKAFVAGLLTHDALTAIDYIKERTQPLTDREVRTIIIKTPNEAAWMRVLLLLFAQAYTGENYPGGLAAELGEKLEKVLVETAPCENPPCSTYLRGEECLLFFSAMSRLREDNLVPPLMTDAVNHMLGRVDCMSPLVKMHMHELDLCTDCDC